MLPMLACLLLWISPQPEIRVRVALESEIHLDHDFGSVTLGTAIIHLPISIILSGNDLLITDPCGNAYTTAGPLTLHEMENGLWSLEDRHFRGNLTLIRRESEILVVNTLPIETYLRGVVPGEMGPEVYPALEALKAQSVAARSYALVQLQSPLDPDYDICATPKCQVYKGADSEHPVTDRAIVETEGLILTHGGMPMATYYTATCGGHTAEGDNIFQNEKPGVYRAVPCFPLEEWTIHGQRSPNYPETASIRKYFSGDMEPRLRKWFGEEPQELFSLYTAYDSSPATLSDMAARLLLNSGFMLEMNGIVETVEEHSLVLLNTEQPLCVDVPALYLDDSHGFIPVSQLTLHPGDRVRIWSIEGHVLALAAKPPKDPGKADGNARRSRWIQFKTWEEISEQTEVLNVRELVSLSDSVEGRHLAMAVHGDTTRILEGLQIRFKLGVPENWFTMIQTSSGVYFMGRGWGHGVGMCQEGAFGMAVAGYDFADILTYYYPGFQIAHW